MERKEDSVGAVLQTPAESKRHWTMSAAAINQLPKKYSATSQWRIWSRTLLLRYLSIIIKGWLRSTFSWP